jgi:hypothetical protein
MIRERALKALLLASFRRRHKKVPNRDRFKCRKTAPGTLPTAIVA